MPALDDPEPLDALAPAARRAAPTVRFAVGSAVVLFVVAVVIAAVVSVASRGGGEHGLIGATDGGAVVGADDAEGAAAVDGRSHPSVARSPMLVHVLGAVTRPGLVELSSGARVVDAIAAAGGLTPEADPAGVNLARAVVDGEQLFVAAVGQAPPVQAGAAGEAGGSVDGLVHLNTADVAALDTLPRIGPALAQRIIDWREANGPFTSVEQLLEVAGIGDAILTGLADRVAP